MATQSEEINYTKYLDSFVIKYTDRRRTNSTYLQCHLFKVILKGLMQRENPELLVESVKQIGKIIAEGSTFAIKAVLKRNVLARLVELFEEKDSTLLKIEVGWIIINITLDPSSDQMVKIFSSGIMETLISLMDSPHPGIRGQSVWAIGNFARFGYIEYLLNSSVIVPLLKMLLPEENRVITKIATWTLCNISRSKQGSEKLANHAVVLVKLLDHSDQDVLDCICLVLKSFWCPVVVQAMINGGMVGRLVDLLKHESTWISSAVFDLVENISFHRIQEMIDCGLLGVLKDILYHPEERIRIRACRLVNLMIIRQQPEIQVLVDNELIHQLIKTINNVEAECRSIATLAIINATNAGSKKLIEYLVECGSIQALFGVLDKIDDDISIFKIMRAIRIILGTGEAGKGQDRRSDEISNQNAIIIIECGGFSKIVSLASSHTNMEICYEASELIRDFFQGKENVIDFSTLAGVETFLAGRRASYTGSRR